MVSIAPAAAAFSFGAAAIIAELEAGSNRFANVLAEKAKVFYESQRKEIAAKTPEGVDPNFRQFVDAMPDQFKGFIDEATKAFHDMAERGRTTVADLQHQVQAARDAAKDPDAPLPAHYFPGDDPTRAPSNRWRSHAHLLFANWINEIYQTTPFDLAAIGR